MTSRKPNCWEAIDCGRGPGGSKIDELGICPAAMDTSVDGINGGFRGGRICWAVAGTFCGGRVQGSRAEKRLTCLHCDFFEQVMHEDGVSGSLPTHMVDAGERRLVAVCGVLAAVWLLVAGLELSAGGASGLRTPVVAGVLFVASLVVAAIARRGIGTHQRAIGLGYSLVAAQALGLTVLENATLGSGLVATQVSWLCVLILVFPLLVSAGPRQALTGSLIAAAIGPIGYGLELVFGASATAELPGLLSRFVPPVVCAFLAVLPARALHRLASDVKRARRLGSYELVARIGTGGMGEVWRARHRMLVRPAAVKLIRPGSGDADRLRRRFEREAQATATLESPHTVQLYDFGISDDGAFYYVMELLRGIDMETLVRRFGPQPPERVVHLLLQVCDSLADAHRIGLVHRDIKPANLYVTIRGRRFDFVKVLDFGLVKLDLTEGDVLATAEGHVVGTPAYMAPETITGGESMDGKADVYALGCVAYRLLTGRIVFETTTRLGLIYAHANLEPVAPSELSEIPIPEALERAVLACLAKDPAQRPDVRQLEEMLTACGTDGSWSQTRAEHWWRVHLRDVLAGDYIEIEPNEHVSVHVGPS